MELVRMQWRKWWDKWARREEWDELVSNMRAGEYDMLCDEDTGEVVAILVKPNILAAFVDEGLMVRAGE